MVKPTKEHFRLIKEQIHYWDKSIDNAKEMLAHARAVKRTNVRLLKKLERMYPE